MTTALSLRRRLQISVVFAIGALAVALYVSDRTTADPDAARTRAGLARARQVTEALAAVAGPDPMAAATAVGEARDAEAGWCTATGELVAVAGTGPRGERVGHPPPPDLRDAIGALCAEPAPSERTVTVRHPRDLTAIVVGPSVGDLAPWAIVRTPAPELAVAPSLWSWPVVVIALAILALAANTFDVIRALRLAAQLAAARERERTLEARLAHEQRLAALGRVVAGVAHEVRNPLAGIKLRLDVVTRSNAAPPQVLEDVQVALGEVARLDRLVTSLLAVARRQVEPEPLALADLVDERLALLAGGAAERGVALRRTGAAQVTSDRDAVCRAVDNLVRNALDVSPRGAEVVVGIAAATPGVVITISDRGPGVAAGVELFEPFSTTKPDGLGLGTFIARSLIAAIGGTITYEREDSWTRMRISLPTS